MNGSTITAVRAARGSVRTCKGWHQEAALRMLMNNLDPEVAEKPDELIVYGGTGRAARSWECFAAIVRSLESLENDETLLIQSGKPVGIFRTHPESPRVLIANSNLVGHWSNWAEFHKLDKLGLTMYGQMTVGSWIYIGSQGIVQGTFETFAAAARKHFGGSLDGRLIVSGGMGGMGGAQPLAATMNGACFLGIDVDPNRIQKRLQTGYCDHMAHTLEEALQMLEQARSSKQAASVGLVGNCADIIPEIARRRIKADIVTDQTSAHDPLNGYVPNGLSRTEALHMREHDPEQYTRLSVQAMGRHVEGMLALQRQGSITATTYAALRSTQASKVRLIFQASFLNTFARCSAKGAGHSAGWHYQATRKTSIGPMHWCWICFPRRRTFTVGLSSRKSASTSKVCRRAYAGWAMANAPSSAWRSTGWFGKVSSKLLS